MEFLEEFDLFGFQFFVQFENDSLFVGEVVGQVVYVFVCFIGDVLQVDIDYIIGIKMFQSCGEYFFFGRYRLSICIVVG